MFAVRNQENDHPWAGVVTRRGMRASAVLEGPVSGSRLRSQVWFLAGKIPRAVYLRRAHFLCVSLSLRGKDIK